MFLALLKKECIQYLKSVVYYVFLGYLVFDFFIQMGTFSTLEKPVPGREDYREYGEVAAEDTEIIMQETFGKLLEEYSNNQYVTYPYGFYKAVVLDTEGQGQVMNVLSDMCGLTEEELERTYEAYLDEAWQAVQKQETGVMIENVLPPFPFSIQDSYSYERFQEDMKHIDTLLSGGSNYSEASIRRNTMQPVSYEQACEVYDNFLYHDKVSNAYARLFCDYEGITLALVTIFLAVSRARKDQRAKAGQVVYSHSLSSAKIILCRYFAGVVMAIIPVFLLSLITGVQSAYYAKHLGVAYDTLAFVKHIGFWLLPTILVTLALGFFLTELTDSVIAILVQVVWWYASLFSQETLIGCTLFNLIPRCNSIVDYESYLQMRETLFWNRGFYTGLAALLLIFTIWVFDRKRKGVFISVGERIKNRRSKLEA